MMLLETSWDPALWRDCIIEPLKSEKKNPKSAKNILIYSTLYTTQRRGVRVESSLF